MRESGCRVLLYCVSPISRGISGTRMASAATASFVTSAILDSLTRTVWTAVLFCGRGDACRNRALYDSSIPEPPCAAHDEVSIHHDNCFWRRRRCRRSWLNARACRSGRQRRLSAMRCCAPPQTVAADDNPYVSHSITEPLLVQPLVPSVRLCEREDTRKWNNLSPFVLGRPLLAIPTDHLA